MLMRRWTPPSPVPTTSLDNNGTAQNHRMCLRWCKLFVSTLIPMALVSFCIVYTLQKERLFDTDYQRQQQNKHEQEQRLLFDTYIQDISHSLLQTSGKNYTDEKILLDIQSKTLAVLRKLEMKRKKDILLYLYERNLIQTHSLNIHGADLNNVELICPYDFSHLHLLGVHWSNATFINCRLTSANFNQAYLPNARFINSTLRNASFVEANLENSHFIQTIIFNTNFYGASLLEANFLQAEIVQGNNFSNTDLYHAKLTHDQLQGNGISVIKHNFDHARYPNGSFELFNSNNSLVVNGDAESEDFVDKQTVWETIDTNMTLSTETMENSTIHDHHWGNYSFVISSHTQVCQTINLYSYSLLIDTYNAQYSFSASAKCDQPYFQINMYRFDGILHGRKTYPEPIEEIDRHENRTVYQYGEYLYRLPIGTRRIDICFGVRETPMKCYFDNIALTIQQH